MVQVNIIGNLGKDAEIKQFGENEWIVFNIASTEKNSNGEQVTQWFSCYKYKGKGNLIEYLKTGTQVYISGKLSVKTTESDKGKFINLNVNVDDLKLLSSKTEQKTEQSEVLGEVKKVEMQSGLPF